MKRKIIIMITSAMVLLAGCSQETVKETENNQAKEENEMKCAYSESDVDLVKEALECEKGKAEAILEVLAEIEICGVEKAEKTDAEEGYAFLMTDKKDREYEVLVDKKYHMYAVKDKASGEYVYTEYE